jgi:hypothetical protein
VQADLLKLQKAEDSDKEELMLISPQEELRMCHQPQIDMREREN